MNNNNKKHEINYNKHIRKFVNHEQNSETVKVVLRKELRQSNGIYAYIPKYHIFNIFSTNTNPNNICTINISKF